MNIPSEIDDVMTRFRNINTVGVSTDYCEGLISIYPSKGVDLFDFFDIVYEADGPNGKPGFCVGWYAPDAGIMTSGDIFVEYDEKAGVEGNARNIQTQVLSTNSWICRIYDKLHI